MAVALSGDNIIVGSADTNDIRRQYEGHNTPLGYYTDPGHRVVVSMMAKGCIVACVLPLRCFLFTLPKFIHVYAIIMQ